MAHNVLSPLDGRYSVEVSPLMEYFSEQALQKYRLLIETEWLIALSLEIDGVDIRIFTTDEVSFLRGLVSCFSEADVVHLHEIESEINHDTKSIEYFIRDRLVGTSLADVRCWIHFACTSEDIDNLAYALMCKGGIGSVWLTLAETLVGEVTSLAVSQADRPMLARTHGQPASPTTLGKEMAVFVGRWQRQLHQIRKQDYLGKFSGAVGNFNAHAIAYPDIDWQAVARTFVERLGLVYNPLTTQADPHDYLAEIFHTVIRFNNIVLDFVRDIWQYIAFGYFAQANVALEISSSTMPHKINPINFERAEANLGLSNSILDHLANKLTISRMQRDLSDSSALRNVGTAIGYSYLALSSTVQGLRKLIVDADALDNDLTEAWEVLGEAVQTIMRKAGYIDAYEEVKAWTRGKEVSHSVLHDLIISINIPEDDKKYLLALVPSSYTGLARRLVDHCSPERL